MKKVKVNEKVAEVFEKVKQENPTNIVHFMWWIQYFVASLTWVKDNHLTDDDVINAYKYGWEVEYEFQLFDVVEYSNDYGYECVGKVTTIEYDNGKPLNVVINYGIKRNVAQIKFLYKIESGEDIKHD